MDKKINVLDLFCGCGGMSWGLKKSGLNFNIIAGIDLWSTALKTYALNHNNAQTILVDISSKAPKDIIAMTDYNLNDIDVIIGGPPCQ